MISRWLRALLLLSVVGTAGELLLMKHYESPWMVVPLVLFGLSVVGVGVVAGSGKREAVVAFRVLMLVFVLSGLVGTFLHYQGKSEFAKERDRTLTGWALARETIFKGANPPLLAPGSMIALGLLGLIWASTLHSPGEAK